MKIDEKTFKAMPAELQTLFQKLPNPGSEEVVGLFPESKGQLVKASTSDTQRAGQNAYGVMARGSNGQVPRGDTGSAARFFYCAKASKRDRDEGCEGLELRPSYMVENGSKTAAAANGVRYDSTAQQRNNHPTVKPTDLMRYLCRLVTPPGGIVLDPFMGSGSTGKASMLEGFNFIGIELDPEYLKIAEARIKHAKENPDLYSEKPKNKKSKKENKKPNSDIDGLFEEE